MDELLTKLTDETQLHIVQFYGQNPGAAVSGPLLTLYVGVLLFTVTRAVAHLQHHAILQPAGELYALNPAWQPAATALAAALQDPSRAGAILYQVTHQE